MFRLEFSLEFVLCLRLFVHKPYTRPLQRIPELRLLTKLSVVNFKGIRKVQLTLSPLTVLVGENGTGKSTVLHALSILKRSTGRAGIITDVPYVNLGPLILLVPPAQTSMIAFEGQDLSPEVSGIPKRTSFGCLVSFDTQGLSEYKTTLNVDGDLIRNDWNRYGVSRIQPDIWKHESVTMNFLPTAVIGKGFEAPGYSVAGSATDDDKRLAQDLHQRFVSLSSVIGSVLQRFFVVGPMRGLIEPVFSLQSEPTEDHVPRGGIVQLGDSLATRLEYNRQNIEAISEWQAEIVGVHLKTVLIPGTRVLLKNPDTGADFVNEGFGSNQMLFILERIANSPIDSVIGVEEPEIHLHPKAQFNFGKWVSRTVPKLKKQLIILTHSPDVVSGILSGVRHKHIEPQDVSIWFFERKDREITANRSEIDTEGKVTGPALKSFLESTATQLSEC